MIACQITELKNFMNKLLTTDCFDAFLLEEAVITTYNTFTINGHLNKSFYTSEEWEDASQRPYALSCWSTLRPLCFSLIKGRKTPVALKFVLQLKPEHMKKLIADSEIRISENHVKAFVLTIRYDGSTMNCITGIALTDFLPDKTPERIWDKAWIQFLEKEGIAYL